MCDSLSELLARGICARWDQLQPMSAYDRRAAIADICADVLWGMCERGTATCPTATQCQVHDSNAQAFST